MIARQSVRVSARTGRLLRMLAALDGRPQAEIAEEALATYVESRKRSLRSRLGGVQRLLDAGGSSAVARSWGRNAAAGRQHRKI